MREEKGKKEKETMLKKIREKSFRRKERGFQTLEREREAIG